MCNKVEDRDYNKGELQRLLKEGLDCVTLSSGIPAEEVFDRIEKEFGFQCCSE